MKILVTGGLGFIGSHLIDQLLQLEQVKEVINIDSSTYAANKNLKFKPKNKYIHYKLDINDQKLNYIFDIHKISYVIHLAAESHVDNSIDDSTPFIQTNINGTHNLLKICLKSKNFKKFIHVSTDEVFGSLNFDEESFKETSPYKPNSPYASSKAASDLIVRSFNKTYGFPSIITNCSNNFGPRQHSEKIIPKSILNLKNKIPIPIYGNGSNIRDWIFVKDHAKALIEVFLNGSVGKQYLIGGNNELCNLRLVNIIKEEYCNLTNDNILDDWYSFVGDRKGHDLRYSIDCSPFSNEFTNWKLSDFRESIRDTIKYYI